MWSRESRTFSTRRDGIPLDYNKCHIFIDIISKKRYIRGTTSKGGSIGSNHQEEESFLRGKDKIKGCKNREFRYICIDCRPDALPKEIDTKPWNRTGDPYTGSWADIEDFIAGMEKEYGVQFILKILALSSHSRQIRGGIIKGAPGTMRFQGLYLRATSAC